MTPGRRVGWGRIPLLLAIVWSTATGGLVRADTLSNVRAQAAAVNAQLQSAQTAYSKDLVAWQVAHNGLIEADTALNAAATQLSELSSQVSAAQARLRHLGAEVAAARALAARDNAKAGSALTVVYEHGSVSLIGVLLGSNTFADFLTRLGFLRSIWKLELGYLQAAERAQAALQRLQAEQTATVARLSTLRSQAAATVNDLQTQQQAALAAKSREDQAVADASIVVQHLIGEKSGLDARIQQLIAEIASRSTSWAQVIADIQNLASQYGVDPLLVEAVVIQESGGNAHVTSSAGAMGLMQLMPGTAASLGVANAYNPIENLRGGITYLIEMLHEFHGNLQLALAAYNAGPYAVKQYGGIPPYQETQSYVRNVLAIYQQGR